MSKASRSGALSRASVAWPPSPEKPAVPVPATVVTVPSGVDAANRVVARVGDVDAVLGVDRQAPRRVEPDGHGLASLTCAVRRRAAAGRGPQHVLATVVGGVGGSPGEQRLRRSRCTSSGWRR